MNKPSEPVEHVSTRSRIEKLGVKPGAEDGGLVDVKVVSFSSILTAEKFAIPVAKRSLHRSGPVRRST